MNFRIIKIRILIIQNNLKLVDLILVLRLKSTQFVMKNRIIKLLSEFSQYSQYFMNLMLQLFQHQTMATSNINENSFEQQNKEMKILKVGIKRSKFLYQQNRLSQEQQIRDYEKRMMQHKKISKKRVNVLEYYIPCYFDESKQIQKEIEKINLNYLEENRDLGIEDINSKFIRLNLEEQNKQVYKVLGFMNKYNTLDLYNQIQEEN